MTLSMVTNGCTLSMNSFDIHNNFMIGYFIIVPRIKNISNKLLMDDEILLTLNLFNYGFINII
jgi:hypothetical protein